MYYHAWLTAESLIVCIDQITKLLWAIRVSGVVHLVTRVMLVGRYYSSQS